MFLVFLLSFAVSSVTFAQAPGGGSGGGMRQGPPSVPTNKQIKKMVAEIAEEVTLTDEQEVMVLAKYQEHFAAVKKKISGSSRPERSEMEALDATFEKEVKELLTEKQVVKYEAYVKTQKKSQRGRP